MAGVDEGAGDVRGFVMGHWAFSGDCRHGEESKSESEIESGHDWMKYEICKETCSTDLDGSSIIPITFRWTPHAPTSRMTPWTHIFLYYDILTKETLP